jgi:predicted homoserine dehydrogenase-like protein
MHLAVIVNRTLDTAKNVFSKAGVGNVKIVTTADALEDAIFKGEYCITDNIKVALGAASIEAVIETTGQVEYGAWAALESIKSGKHTFVLNCEMDATVGPLMKKMADDRGVIYSNSDGDEPGVACNLARHVATMGLEVVGAGNLKGFYDPHRTPETQQAFADANNQKVHMITSFVDGTKLSMELTVTANALGFGVGKRGMYGVTCDGVRTCLEHFPDGTFEPGKGVVDFLLGASPHTGAFVIGHTDHPMKQDYLKYLKMGDGPLYVFYTPFHLPQLEIPITVSRGVLCNDTAVAPKGKPYCDAIAIAKKDLKKGDILDGIGGFSTYTLIDNSETSLKENLLPMGVAQNCVMKRDVSMDVPLKYSDVELPKGRLIYQIQSEMVVAFFDTNTG